MEARIEARPGLLLVEAPGDYEYLATVPPGQGRARWYAIVGVPEDYRVPQGVGLGEALASQARRAGAPEGSLALLTAADTSDPIVVEEEDYTLVATVGLHPPACPGMRAGAPLPATINVVALVHRPLATSAALDLLRVIAEAKAAASWEALLRCGSPGESRRPVGTVTDAIVVAWPGGGPGDPGVAGHATSIGSRIGGILYRRLYERASGDPLWYLERSLGVGLEGILDIVGKAYSLAPVPGVPVEEAVTLARRLLEAWLRDPNVAAVIVAAGELEVRGASGTLPGVPREWYQEDSPGIVADELLGMTLAEYLAGTRGVMAMVWLERLKKKGLLGPEPGVFEDDIVMALAASALSRVLSKLLGGEP